MDSPVPAFSAASPVCRHKRQERHQRADQRYFALKSNSELVVIIMDMRLRMLAILANITVASALGSYSFLGTQLASWNSAPASLAVDATAAVMPAPGSASGVTGSTTSTSSYGATFNGYYCSPIPDMVYDGLLYIGSVGLQCEYTWLADGTGYNDNPIYEYSCPDGGYLSGSNCIANTTTPDLKFTWATPTAYDTNGQPLVTGVDVVEGSSCSASSWTNVATVSPSADSYTVDNPSTSEYYGIRTVNESWLGPVTSCTQG